MTSIRTRPESVQIAVLLAGVGGFLDAYTFVGHRVFANAQTGNVVLFGVYAASRQWHSAVVRLVPVLAFMVGVLAVEVLGTPRIRDATRRPVRLAVAVQIGVLAFVASLPDDAPALLTTVCVSFAAALQFSMFRVLGDSPYNTVMTSGNLRSTVVAAYRWLIVREQAAAPRAGRFAAVVGAFTAGVVVGALCTQHLGPPAAAVPAALLIVVMAMLIRETWQRERRAAAPAPPPATAQQSAPPLPMRTVQITAYSCTK